MPPVCIALQPSQKAIWHEGACLGCFSDFGGVLDRFSGPHRAAKPVAAGHYGHRSSRRIGRYSRPMACTRMAWFVGGHRMAQRHARGRARPGAMVYPNHALVCRTHALDFTLALGVLGLGHHFLVGVRGSGSLAFGQTPDTMASKRSTISCRPTHSARTSRCLKQPR